MIWFIDLIELELVTPLFWYIGLIKRVKYAKNGFNQRLRPWLIWCFGFKIQTSLQVYFGARKLAESLYCGVDLSDPTQVDLPYSTSEYGGK